MNQHPGVFGRKLGMTQLFAEDGTLVPCTVVESKTVVLAKRTKDKDGYDALVVGSDDKKDGRVNKAQAGQFKKSGVSPKQNVRESPRQRRVRRWLRGRSRGEGRPDLRSGSVRRRPGRHQGSRFHRRRPALGLPR